jgi:hypothetical protein
MYDVIVESETPLLNSFCIVADGFALNIWVYLAKQYHHFAFLSIGIKNYLGITPQYTCQYITRIKL